MRLSLKILIVCVIVTSVIVTVCYAAAEFACTAHAVCLCLG